MELAAGPSRLRVGTVLFTAFALLALTIVLLGPRLAAPGTDTPLTNPTDFRAFYCGGAAIAVGGDPYRVQPLMACEQAALKTFGLVMIPNFVLPAPLPPYALSLFAGFSLLPFPVASICWLVIAVVAIVVTIVAVVRLSRLPIPFVAAVLLGADAYASLVIGQIVPIVVCALVLSALALRAENYALATLAFGVAAIEPHIALPAILATFVLVGRARVPILLLGAALVAISIASVGGATCLEYLDAVLPAHARSEVAGFGAQYSLTSLLYAFGVSEQQALRLGEASYALMTLAAIFFAARIAKRTRDAAFIVLVPGAFAPFGGVFVHIHQMAAAVPLALVLLSRSQRIPLPALLAVIALAIPWESIAETPPVVNLYARGHIYTTPHLPSVRPNALAEEPEAMYMTAGGSYFDGRTRFEMLLWKAPTWFALIVLSCATVALAVRPRWLIRPSDAKGAAM